METKQKNLKTLKGKVVSAAMDKTVVVAVDTFKEHSKYRKKYMSTKKYKAHDEENSCKVGDEVTIVSSKPRSKDKTFEIVK